MIELEDLRTHLRLPFYDYLEDAYIEALEVAAVSYVENLAHRRFQDPEEAEQLYDGTGEAVIWLKDIPSAGATTTVETWDGADWVETPAEDYVLDGYALRHLSSIWAAGPRNVRVTTEAGYEVADVPTPIRQAVLLCVAHWYQNREPVPTGLLVASAEVPHAVHALVGPYRRLQV